MKQKWNLFMMRHRNKGIPNLIQWLVFGMGAVTVANFIMQGRLIPQIHLSFHLPSMLQGEWWRVLTFFFVPPNMNLLFTVLYLAFIFWVGRSLTSYMGSFAFTVYYFMGIVLTVALSCLTGFAATPYYVNMSLLLALAAYDPDRQILLWMIIPLKLKYLAVADLVFMILPLFSNFLSWSSLFPLMPLIPFALFCGRMVPDMFHFVPHKQYKKTIEFRSAVRQRKDTKGYLHCCAVCGKTDASDPKEEFRYCSLCQGYKCYCSQHIFTHEHK